MPPARIPEPLPLEIFRPEIVSADRPLANVEHAESGRVGARLRARPALRAPGPGCRCDRAARAAPLLRLIAPLAPGAKVITSLPGSLLADVMASRSRRLPRPESRTFFTLKVSAHTAPHASSTARTAEGQQQDRLLHANPPIFPGAAPPPLLMQRKHHTARRGAEHPPSGHAFSPSGHTSCRVPPCGPDTAPSDRRELLPRTSRVAQSYRKVGA